MNKFTPKTPRREKSNLSSSSESQKDPVNVYCRLRNLRDDQEASCISLISPTVLSLTCPTESKILRKDIQYCYNHIFTQYATQKEVFEHVAFPLLEGVLHGRNGLLFTYGVTGSGKTYTLTGDCYNPGIMPRCIDTIFNTISEFQAQKFVIKSDRMNGFEVQSENDAVEDRIAEQKSQSKTGSLKRKDSKTSFANDGLKILGVNETNLYAVFVSYTEIYNNVVYDLLDDSAGKTLQSKILREDPQRNMYVNGVMEMEVKSASEAFELYNSGQKRKRMGHTILNAESSRSHSIFNIRVVQLVQSCNNEGERIIPDRNRLIIGQLSLVDLAGSERTNRTQNTGMRLKEASAINNSLMSLRSCLEILRDNQMNNANRLVPYRDSRLTLLFKNYFEGDGKVNMIVCVNPSTLDYEENVQVMKFAELTQDVKIIKPESRYTPYRKTPRHLKTPATKTKIQSIAPLVFGPRIPNVSLDIENIEEFFESINRLEHVLQIRKQKSALFNRELEAKESKFRKRLMQVNTECTLQQTELRSMQQQFRKERKRNQNLELKVLELEKMNGSLEGKQENLTDVIHTLRGQLNEKDLKLNQNLLEKERQKQKLAQKQERMQQELDEKLRRQRDHINAKMQSSENRIRKAREILENNYPISSVESEKNFDHETQTDINIKQIVTPLSLHSSQINKNVASTPRRNYAVSNRRRSRSMGEVWLEHNSIKPVPLGTVMQPSMKRRKSVTKLSKASDITNTKQSKYCLIAQEADTDGEVETKVYKADIVPTCGGGAQVIFNDVERLTQESPTSTPQK